MKKQINFTFIFTLLLLPCFLLGQLHQDVDLVNLYRNGKLKSVNREIEIASGDRGAYLKITENKKDGIVWLPVKDFQNGAIEIELRGKDVFQRSFIGIVFHGIDAVSYDAVYCRPFNFSARDSIRRIHAVQYISHPNFTWEKLRKGRNAVFEKEIINPPNAGDWFTMKLVVDGKTVKVYINNAAEPSLTVEKLNNRTSGKIGLFTADSSGGDFKTIKISYKKSC